MKNKYVLVACEESQTVCKAFRDRGFYAFSCDIQECSGGFPEWHIQDNALSLLNGGEFITQDCFSHYVKKWDLIIAHPPCTFLSNVGNRWYNIEKYGFKAMKRRYDQEIAKDFFMKFVYANCEKIAIENPVGVMSTYYRKPDQIIEPYQFGEPYSKRTCLWLKNLPLIQPSNIVDKGEYIVFKSGKRMPKWYADAAKNPKERSKIRSKTFKGIAEAMAEQWGVIL